jgi:hypothetical protein
MSDMADLLEASAGGRQREERYAACSADAIAQALTAEAKNRD